MTTVDNHHIVNSHSSVGSIQVTDNDSSIKPSDGNVVDEEIDSCEGEDYDEKMFQVALVNSVMDTRSRNGVSLQQAPGEMSPRSRARFALRKRRRPGEESTVAAPNHTATSVAGNSIKIEAGTAPNVLDIPNDPLNELQHVQDNGVSSISTPPIQLSAPTPLPIKPEPTQQQPVTTMKHNTIKQENIEVVTRGLSQPGIILKPPRSAPAVLQGIAAPSSKPTRMHITQAASIKSDGIGIFMSSSTGKKKAPRKRKAKPPKATAKTKVAERLSIPVPNPLLANTSPMHQSMNHSVLRGRQDMIVTSTSVPCPLPVPSPLDVVEVKAPNKISKAYIPPFDPTKLTKVSENSATDVPSQTRTRVFSVDLDPSTFDFSDLSSITGGNVDNNKASADSDLPIFQGRDRAFSFEVFNFAGGDDLLPNPVSSSSMLQAPSLAPVNVEAPTRRPRGDSIIFDPASFQDGGIHEKNALEKARLKDLPPMDPPQQMVQRHVTERRSPVPSGGGITGTFSTSQSSNPLPLLLPPGPSLNHATPMVRGQSRVIHPAHNNSVITTGSKSRSVGTSASGSRNRNSVQIATLPSSLSAGSASNAQSPPTFQMELLNKDGRIGIYLPEARRLRIARFHAKRKMRIW
eukprot:CAMPEP_0201218372 /NCGR_PEP_ID=MMETSP0851-20130426/190543_1 /ASSEMBLY_ACC=CAM_ASM_000631 /TAXON_ID=183588 /ORGANISM="Pseudo-nitzschia fraudulenta, Strain WWA7" /LENGTH=629 /DNA_ID=CAMNT_0047508053 /DNA_START=33 /DNA_END=1919 /DNA_ORIENTATION=+